MSRLLALLFLLPLLALAQDTSIRFTNATPNIEVPILDGSAPIIDNLGNIYAQCELQPSLGVCVGMDATPAGTAPTLTFERSGSGSIAPGGSATFTWTSGNSPELCFASAVPANAGWAGSKALNGSQAVTFSTAGTNTVYLKCYNNAGASPQRSVAVTVSGTPEPPDPPDPVSGCNVVKAEIADETQRALFQPTGYEQLTRTWAQVFGTGASSIYPSTPSDFYPVGSWTLAGFANSPPVSLRGKYLSIPITGIGTPYQLQWNSAKPVYGYAPARFANAVYVTISTCAGDFRTTGAFQYTSPDPVNDPNFVTQCRSTNTSEALLSHGPATSGALFCPVESGSTYYINIVYANVLDGLSPSETGCANTSTAACEISVKHRPTL
jgi:hypothetical protein